MDAFCFNYQHVDCLYKLFKHRFSGKIPVKKRQLTYKVQRAVHFNHHYRGVNRKPSIVKKNSWGKSTKKTLSYFQETKSTQTSESASANEIEQVKKRKVELELIKIVDWFLDGHGNHTSDLVSFKKNLCKLTILWIPTKCV